MVRSLARSLVGTLAATGLGLGVLIAQPALPGLGIDHIILETGSLQAGMAEFARLTGVTPIVGGQHPGRGTQNALVSLGGGRYLELLAPIVDAEAPGPLKLSGWAVHTDQIDGVRDLLRARGVATEDVRPGSRKLPSGGLLEWKTLGIPDSLYGAAPFFIQWSAASVHPSKTSPMGCTLERLTIADGPPYRTLDLLSAIGLEVSVERGSRPGMTLRLRCPRGIVDFPS